MITFALRAPKSSPRFVDLLSVLKNLVNQLLFHGFQLFLCVLEKEFGLGFEVIFNNVIRLVVYCVDQGESNSLVRRGVRQFAGDFVDNFRRPCFIIPEHFHHMINASLRLRSVKVVKGLKGLKTEALESGDEKTGSGRVRQEG